MRPLIAFGLTAALTGCYSAEDIRQLPVEWTSTYQVSYAQMANCLSSSWANTWTVVPQHDPDARSADILLSAPQSGTAMAEYQIRETAGASKVTFRSKPGIGHDSGSHNARERADRCAKQS